MDKRELVIVIPCKNERGYIETLLLSLLEQSYDLKKSKIYIADAGSTDGTIEEIKKFSDRLPIEIIGGGLPSVARNKGASLADGQFVLFIDADMKLSRRRLIEKTVDLAKRKNLDCVTTNIFCRDGGVADFFIYFFNNISQYLSILINKPFSSGMYMLFRRDRFLELGGFDEKVFYAEDYFLSKQVGRKKFGIVFDYVLATNRRFKKTGYLKIIRMFISNFLHSNDKEFFYKDKYKSYWQ